MIVLGLNGSGRRGDHDAAACLLVDGRIVAFIEEERFTRRKHAWHSAAHTAAAACLDAAGLKLDDADAIAYGWDLPLRLRHQGLPGPKTPAEAFEAVLPGWLFPTRSVPPVEFVPHHVAHAASAFHFSGAGSGPIIVLDGQGERESISVAAGTGRDIKVLDTWPIAASLGYFYEAACEFAGLGSVHSGKLMGLAPHGTPRPGVLSVVDPSRPRYELDPTTGLTDLMAEMSVFPTEIHRRWQAYFARVWDQPANPVRPRYDRTRGDVVDVPDVDPFEYRDFAATVQQTLETVALGIVADLLARVPGDVLHLAGGVGYNATLNGILLDRIGDRRLFVQPVAGDAGVALGAAAHVAAQAGDRIVPLGPDLGFGQAIRADDVRRVLDRCGLRYDEPTDLTGRVADLVAGGRVVGWFEGGAEVGPRALGHRSIVASPGSTALRDRINIEIKQREVWRPFAPSIRADALPDLIDTRAEGLPYMVVTAPVRDDWRDRLAGVTHVDGTTRPQSVVPAATPAYARLIDDVVERTGVPAVLNTSFNGRGEPLVETPTQAVTGFVLNGLDALVMPPFLVTADRTEGGR